MSVEPSKLIQRISETLKSDVGPEVGNEFAKTQAFMASVVLGKVSKQLELGEGHSKAESTDMSALTDALSPVLGDASEVVATALAKVGAEQTVESLGELIESLYAESADLREQALALIRPVLRRDIDRRMEIAT